jgi:hypothetical protein
MAPIVLMPCVTFKAGRHAAFSTDAQSPVEHLQLGLNAAYTPLLLPKIAQKSSAVTTRAAQI